MDQYFFSPTLVYGTYMYLSLLFPFVEESCVTTAVRMSYHVNATVYIEPDSTQVREESRQSLQANYVRHFHSDKYHEIRACVSGAVK
jgi:hypothetical protein